MKIGAVILSRFSSSRLPGKALMKIKEKQVLMYIIERLSQVFEMDQIVIATSNQSSDDPIAEFAHSKGVNCFRGSLENVAERFYDAAATQNWDYAIRINGDNIFLDTKVLKEMVQIVESNAYDFVSNVKDRTFPKGMSIEIVKLDYYKNLLSSISTDEKYFEHVTSYLYEHDANQNFYYVYNTTLPELSGIQMALDTVDDLERSTQIIAHFEKNQWEYNMEEIHTILKNINHD